MTSTGASVASQTNFDKGVEFRLKGNASFKEGDYTEALRQYYFAILHLRTVGGNKEKKIFEEKANEQLVMIYNNMSNVYSKQNKWERVIEYATMVTALDPKNKKATFRLGQAYLRQGKADKAKPLLEDVLKMDPNDALVKSEIARLEEDEQHMENREKNIYRKMFS